MEGIIMAKKLGKLFTLAVTAGTAAAAAYYYLQNKKAAVQEAPEEEDDFEKDPEDDFDDTDFTDDDFVDESEHPEEAKEEAKEDTPVFSSETLLRIRLSSCATLFSIKSATPFPESKTAANTKP